MKLDMKSFILGLVTGGGMMLVLCVVLLLVTAELMLKAQQKAKSYPPTAACPTVGAEEVTSALKPIRQKFGIPAMSAALITSDGIQFVGAVGERKRGTDVPVGLDDQWHLGSDGKAMTSTLIARLVERGQLTWDTTLGDIFPDLAPGMDPAFQKTTILQVLSHHAGLPPNMTWGLYRGNDTKALRLKVVREALSQKPIHPPGSTFEYSNLGYVIAGAVVEKITGQPWEVEIQKEIFDPLQMTNTGFGGTGTPGKIDQPWPHTADGEPTAENGPEMDNPPVMGPAGCIHCSIQDWAKFIQDQLRGDRGEKALLQPGSYQTLHTPHFGGDYALGWLTANRSWGGGKVLNHGGDNTMNFANVWIAPKRDFAILVCANESGDTAFQATDAAVGELIKLHDEKFPGN
jgi:CubicO group peptidase (beta-lactamase class C family)